MRGRRAACVIARVRDASVLVPAFILTVQRRVPGHCPRIAKPRRGPSTAEAGNLSFSSFFVLCSSFFPSFLLSGPFDQKLAGASIVGALTGLSGVGGGGSGRRALS